MIVIWDYDDNTILIYCWLLVWNMTSTFPETVGNKIIIPIDSYFQRGRYTTNQSKHLYEKLSSLRMKFHIYYYISQVSQSEFEFSTPLDKLLFAGVAAHWGCLPESTEVAKFLTKGRLGVRCQVWNIWVN